MSKFLEDFLVTMPDTQRKKLIELLTLKQKEGIIKSETELQLEIERLLLDIENRSKGPMFQARLQNGKIDSASFNANMEEIAFDLSALFTASATIDRLMNDNQQLSRSLLGSIKKNIATLEARLQRLSLLMNQSNQFSDVIYEQFNAAEYMETDEKTLQTLRKNRFDKYMPEQYNAEIVGDSLQLAGVQAVNQLENQYGKRLARIEVVNRTGHVYENPEHGIDKAIDNSLETYWAETILVDQPIQKNVNDIWSETYNNIPKDGAMCEIEITLNGVTTVSNIQIDPFCSYPLEVVSIYGYETESLSGTVYELISPNHANPYQRSQKSVHQMNFQFPAVDISKLRILFRQENYVKENYIIEQDELQSQELWRKLTTSNNMMDDYKQPEETIATFNRKNEITGWAFYLEELTKWASTLKQQGLIEAAKQAMESIRLGDYKNPLLLRLRAMTSQNQEAIDNDDTLSKTWHAVNKISYLYGAYNISIYGRKYKSESIYITKPLPLSTNATRISLDVVEKHYYHEGEPSTDEVMNAEVKDQSQITDIEYYITHKKNPLATDWKPILPVSKKYVRGELLSGDLIHEKPPEFQEIENRGEALVVYSLRFPVESNETLLLRRNNTPMDPKTYVISEDGTKIAIYSKYYTASSMYTVDYKPKDSAWVVELNQSSDVIPTQYINTNGETGEYFAFADFNNTIQLKHKPYLFRKSLFSYDFEKNEYTQKADQLKAISPEFPIIVRVNGEEYLNITSYATQTYDEERLTENEGKAFAQIGNTIIFGRPIDGSKIENITVDYYYVTTDIRMKAILRRNSIENESITPCLYSYQIRCQSYDQLV